MKKLHTPNSSSARSSFRSPVSRKDTPQFNSHRRSGIALLVAASLALLSPVGVQSANASSYIWDAGGGTGATTWSTATNWNPDGTPTFLAGDTFDLSTLNIAATSTSTMDTANTLGTIQIGDTNNTNSWTLSLTSALTLDGNGSEAAINQISTSKGDTINGAGGILLASDLNLTNASGNTLSISTGVTAPSGTWTITNNGSGTGQVNFNSAIGSGINLVQNSTTSKTVLLASSTSFNGTVTIKAGALTIGAASAYISLGASGGFGVPITLGDTSGSSAATLNLITGNGGAWNNPINVASGSSGTKFIVGAVTSGNNSYTLNGAITLGADSGAPADVTIGNTTGSTSTFSVAGGITGFGNVTVKSTSTGRTRLATTSINNTGTLTNAGSSTGVAQIDAVVGANVTGIVQNSSTSAMNLNAANTSFAGDVTVSAGTLGVQNANALHSSNTVAVASGATFSLQTATLTIAGLNDSTTGGTVSNTVANTLTLGGSGIYSFSGVIQNGTGTQTVTKTGAGTQTLGGVNTYSGATTVSAGTLAVNGSLTGGGNTTVASGATLAGTGAISGRVTASGTISGGLTLNGDAVINSGATAAAAAFNGNVSDNGTITSSLSLQSGKTLSGTGTVAAVTAASTAIVAPGNAGAGILTVATGNDFSLNSGAHLAMQLGGNTAGATYDQVLLQNGTVNLNADSGAGATLDLSLSYVPTAGDTLFLILNGGGGAINGAFNGFAEGSTIDLVSSADSSTYAFTLTYQANGDGGSTANDVALIAAVPEPSTWAMMFSGLGMLSFWQRNRRKSA